MAEIGRITKEELTTLRVKLLPLIGTQFKSLSLPKVALKAFEPSQVGTIVGSLMDALIPHLSDIPQVGLQKHEGILGDREGYPDYKHESGFRLELKLVYVDNTDLQMKKPPTPREPSARLTEKVTEKNVDKAKDALLVIAYQLRPQPEHPDAVSPTIIDLEVLSMAELIEARDKRMTDAGGRWFGDYETPAVLSKIGRAKLKLKQPLDAASYGAKMGEGKDYNKDTNFGKLARIPHTELEAFLAKHCLTEMAEEDADQESLPKVLEELPPGTDA